MAFGKQGHCRKNRRGGGGELDADLDIAIRFGVTVRVKAPFESRTHIIPGKRKYLFVYPFVKTRDWFLLPLEERQKVMDVHIRVGNKYPSVKLNTTYSFGLDDQEFVVAFETEEPKDFLDLVMELRETQSSKYTLRDTPIFTCVQTPMENLLDQLF